MPIPAAASAVTAPSRNTRLFGGTSGKGGAIVDTRSRGGSLGRPLSLAAGARFSRVRLLGDKLGYATVCSSLSGVRMSGRVSAAGSLSYLWARGVRVIGAAWTVRLDA